MPFSILLLWLQVGTPAGEPKQLHWFEIVTGVLGIPAALIGLAYSYVLIRKTRLEAVKAELEIEEKRRSLAEPGAPADQPATTAGAQPSFRIHAEAGARQVVNLSFDPQDRAIQLVILRFILLYLLLQGWRLLATTIRVGVGGGFLGLAKLFGWSTSIDFDKLSWWQQALAYGVVSFEDVIYWALFLLLGIPLIRDLNRILGITMKNFWKKEPPPAPETNPPQD